MLHFLFKEELKEGEGAKREKNGTVRNSAAEGGWVFGVCLEKGDWDEARARSLTSMDCSLGSMPAKSAPVRACVCFCVLVPSNHDLHTKVELFDDNDRDSCHNKITAVAPRRFLWSFPLSPSARFSLSPTGSCWADFTIWITESQRSCQGF